MICNYDNCCSENKKRCCNECMSGLAVLVEIIGGLLFTAIVVLLFINGILTSAEAIATAALISGLVYLGVLTASSLLPDGESLKGCVGCNLAGIITGIFGTVFSAVIGIAVTFTAGDTISAVILGIIAFFFAYMIISTFFLVKSCIRR